MTRVLFAKIPDYMQAESLAAFVRKSFPHKENKGYFNAIEKRKNIDSVKESFAALALLRELLRMSDIEADRLVFRRCESGKPYFEDANLHFSLSHSKGYVAAALSDSSPVGLDLECACVPPDKARRLAERWFNESEKSEISNRSEDFTRIWTKKEAYAKMRGIGLGEPIVSEKSSRTCTENEQEKTFFAYFEAEGYPLTTCLEKNDGEIDFNEINLENLIKKAEN